MQDSTQPSTQNPQSSATSSSFGGDTSQVQAVSSNDVLSTGQNSIPLIVNSVPVVSLESTSATTQTFAQPVVHHKTNDLALGFAAILFIAALAMFWAFSRQTRDTK